MKTFTYILILFTTVLLLSNCQNKKNSDKSNDDLIIEEALIPDGLIINYANWNWNWSSVKEFKDFSITLTNNSNKNLKMVKYRLAIYIYKGRALEKVFSKSYVYSQTLYSGDVVRIQIDDLSGFYLGVNVSQDSSFEWIGEIENIELIEK